MSGAGTAVCGVAVAGGVVNFNSRLVVVAIHMEAHAVAPVLHGPGSISTPLATRSSPLKMGVTRYSTWLPVSFM